jgi:hypothetical protein
MDTDKEKRSKPTVFSYPCKSVLIHGQIPRVLLRVLRALGGRSFFCARPDNATAAHFAGPAPVSHFGAGVSDSAAATKNEAAEPFSAMAGVSYFQAAAFPATTGVSLFMAKVFPVEAELFPVMAAVFPV